MAEDGTFQITLGDFSGPLDLLCHLVESSEIDASSIKLTELLSQYSAYLVRSRAATLSELADFFALASRILIRKVRSLLPKDESDEPDDDSPDERFGISSDDEMTEETLAAMLERFRPYRAAAAKLDELKAERERSFVRISDDQGPPWFDIGDLYSLSTLWWTMIDEYSRHRASSSVRGFMEDIPDAVPEEILVERRMDEICERLAESGRTALSLLLGHFGENSLIVTLLALLELSRLGRLDMTQLEEWGDVSVEAG
ncbi:MAG: segregation/condensation protein A [Synergistaceae bacterium]|jgi:segregation and condensation protein A|nr:segregation/condensation protein A [Synergistaceae bacterium]